MLISGDTPTGVVCAPVCSASLWRCRRCSWYHTRRLLAIDPESPSLLMVTNPPLARIVPHRPLSCQIATLRQTRLERSTSASPLRGVSLCVQTLRRVPRLSYARIRGIACTVWGLKTSRRIFTRGKSTTPILTCIVFTNVKIFEYGFYRYGNFRVQGGVRLLVTISITIVIYTLHYITIHTPGTIRT